MIIIIVVVVILMIIIELCQVVQGVVLEGEEGRRSQRQRTAERLAEYGRNSTV